ncbi:MAG: lipopolysaccharide transport periplasmic protein LptA [Burkholderiales bacterium]|nr:lipopolysaccharide transport periplasmic protein LptA [Burkholderiales bacterium]
MSISLAPISHALRIVPAALALLACPAVVRAERADRTKPMVLESGPCVVNVLKQASSCTGPVVITQGTLALRSDRVELRETPEGYRQASVTGVEGKQAQYRQKRDGVDEYIEGVADRIDYDSRASTIRFEGQALVRLLRGGQVADELHGSVIVWDSTAELFNVQGGTATAANPGGRVRLVSSPPAEAASGASAPAAPARAASAPPLRSSSSLGERR